MISFEFFMSTGSEITNCQLAEYSQLQFKKLNVNESVCV